MGPIMAALNVSPGSTLDVFLQQTGTHLIAINANSAKKLANRAVAHHAATDCRTRGPGLPSRGAAAFDARLETSM